MFCAACFEVEHVVHECALLDLGRMCMDGREAQTCDTQVEQVCKSKQTHEPCVALDLALLTGSECVKDESLELERCVEGSFAASEPSSSIDGHRRAGCGLFELLTPVMLLTETQLRDAVIGLISAVLAVVSCSFAWMGKLGRRLMNAGLSCRRPQKPQKSERRLFQISLWLKLAVFSPYLWVLQVQIIALRAMTSEETAQILAHGRQRVPSPLQRQTMARADVKEFLSLFGNVGLDALASPDARPLSRVFEGPFQENGLMNPWQVGPIAEEQELIIGPRILRSLGKWVPVTSPSLEMSMRLERSVWANHLWNPTISASVAYLILKNPGLPQDGLGRETLPTALRKRSSLIFLPATSMMDNEEQQDVGKRRRFSAGMVTEDVERRVSERLARRSVGSFVWDSGVRDQDVVFCVREEQRNSTMVLALLAIQTCLRVYEELKVDEARLLRLHFPSDLSPRQPALIPGVLFGEAVLRNLPRAYQICVAEANRRIADFRRRNLASSSGSASMPPPAASASMPPPSASASMPPPAASPPMPPPVFPPLPPALSAQVLTPLAVAQAKHSGGASVWRIRVGYGAEASSSKVPSATDAFLKLGAMCLFEVEVWFGRACSYDSSTNPCWWIWGQCSSYHTGRDCGAVGRFISSNAMESSYLRRKGWRCSIVLWRYEGHYGRSPVIPRPPNIPPAPMLGVNLSQPPAPMTPPPAMPLEPAIPPAPAMPPPEDLVSPPPSPSRVSCLGCQAWEAGVRDP